jgi:para-aminobenzoate synthetase component I
VNARHRPPLRREIEPLDPQRLLDALDGLPHAFVFHSALPNPHGAWSFFGADPFSVHGGGDHALAIAEFRAIAARARAGLAALDDAPPFAGGLVGLWAYDYGRRLERIVPSHGRSAARDDLGLPDCVVGLYDVVGAIHHPSARAWLVSTGLPLEGEAAAAHADRRLAMLAARLDRARAAAQPDRAPANGTGQVAVSTFTPGDYGRAIETVREHIRAGDIFQANLSQRWTLPLPPCAPRVRAAALFEALTRVSAAPHAAYFDAGAFAVASASPERFLELRDRRVTTRPIKGTRPRGATGADDARLRAALLASAKDRAENVMIVDVLRNDLGRVCETGTVEVPALCELETYPQVFHLTSTVTGTLGAGHDAFDLLHACFPGGSITGAPKIRAMEILEGLEPVRRHVYTGSLGYVDWRGDADWNIAIRTALVTPDAVHFAAGGGITADSDARAEYEETLHKAEGLRRALEPIAGPVALAPPQGSRT